MAIGTLGRPERLQRIVRAAVARPPLGVSAFRIRHISTSANLSAGAVSIPVRLRVLISRSAPQRSSQLSIYNRTCLVPVPATTGQIPLQTSLQTRCMGKASSTCSRRMSSKSRPPPSIKTDFRLAFVDFDFFPSRDGRNGPVVQIEAGIQGKSSRFPGTGRTGTVISTVLRSPDVHLPVRMRQQLGRSLAARKGEICSRSSPEKSICPRLEGFVETNLPQFHLFDTKEHKGILDGWTERPHYNNIRAPGCDQFV